jgi:hypothetical protein
MNIVDLFLVTYKHFKPFVVLLFSECLLSSWLHRRIVLLVLVSNPLEFQVLITFCHQIFFSATFKIDHPTLPLKPLAHICAWGCSTYSIDLRILLFQSLRSLCCC